MFALLDCNNFYASCERVFNPQLNNKAIVVLSNNDGCVIARTAEAKALGIPMGAPAFQYEEIFDAHGVHVFSANFPLYGDMSHRVMSIAKRYTAESEIYSIDEIFLHFAFAMSDYQGHGRDLVRHIKQSTGIPTSIGFAANKTLAKIANKIAKQFPEKTAHSYVIDSTEKRIKALRYCPIEDVWGIGRQHAKKLKQLGIHTAYQFACMEAHSIRQRFSVVEQRLHKELQGEVIHHLEETKPKQNIATTRSFSRHITELSQLEERVATFTVSCAEKLRQQQSYARAVSVFLQTNRFRPDKEQYAPSQTETLPYPTDSTHDLVATAKSILSRIYRAGYEYKRAGVVIMNLVPNTHQQLSLFDEINPKHASLFKTVDTINQHYGSNTMRLAVQDQKRWQMKQQRLSPKYTTNVNDFITVKI